MLRDPAGRPVSRAGKPLYGLSHIPTSITDAEIFVGSWEQTVSLVRSQHGRAVPLSGVYQLTPTPDPRLVRHILNDPTPAQIDALLRSALLEGHEGIVLRQGDTAWKVKPIETYDVPVLGATNGKGKYDGLIGALVTPMGKVSGMTDEQRKRYTDKLPTMIEVECTELTKAGKFRHPRFKRERFDKSHED